jgi:hypothetical protein
LVTQYQLYSDYKPAATPLLHILDEIISAGDKAALAAYIADQTNEILAARTVC